MVHLGRALLIIAAATVLSPLAFAAGHGAPRKVRPDTAVGEALFVGNCSGCHVLRAAGSSGVVGPNLDKYRPPSLAYIKYQVTHGGGVMPAFTRFTTRQVADIAAFVWTRK